MIIIGVIDPGNIVAKPITLKYAAMEDMLSADKMYSRQKNITYILISARFIGVWICISPSLFVVNRNTAVTVRVVVCVIIVTVVASIFFL
tara:strand:- start:2304 stop:2573 length:270 start_codon:yes stop_codon:yes gene_type:complete